MSKRWLVATILVALPATLAGQAMQLSPRDSLVTAVTWKKACAVVSLEEDVSRKTRELSIAGEDPDARKELNTAIARLSLVKELRTSLSRNESTSLHWLCTAQDLRFVPAGVELPSRTQVIAWAEQVKSVERSNNVSLDAGGGFLSVLGIDESAIISGLTTLILDRAAEEIQIAFVEKISRKICDPPAIKPLFGSTCAVLRQQHLKLRKAVLRELHSAVRSDLQALPHTAPLAAAWSGSFQDNSMPAEQQDVVLMAYVLGTTFAGVLEGKDPINSLSTVLNSDPDVLPDANGRGLLEATLARTPPGNVKLPGAAVLQRLALVGLILPDTDGDGLAEWPGPTDRLNVIKALAINLSGWLKELGLRQATVDRALNDAVTIAQRIQTTRIQIDELRSLLKDSPANSDSLLGRYAGVVDGALAMGEEWARIVDQYREPGSHLAVLVGDLRQATRALAGRDYAAAAVSLYIVADSLAGRDLAVPSTARMVLSITTALAQAKDGDEVAAVLQAYAEPVQGYRGKRGSTGEGKLYLALNAYLGAGAGSERVDGRSKGYAGVSAPVGLEVGGPVGKGWSLGLFAQLLDLGALASYRLDDNDVETEPKIGFAQVLSPGGYLVIGFPGVPLALGLGANFAPSLRKISADEDDTRNATRLGAFLSIDMPLFRFK